jgi:hypothetical protein
MCGVFLKALALNALKEIPGCLFASGGGAVVVMYFFGGAAGDWDFFIGGWFWGVTFIHCMADSLFNKKHKSND